MTMLPTNQQAPRAPTAAMFGGSPWAAPLAAIFGGLSAAGQPGGWSNFGAGVASAQQNFQSQQMDRERFRLLQQQAQREQGRYDDEQRRANQEAAERERIAKAYADFLGGGQQVQAPNIQATGGQSSAIPGTGTGRTGGQPGEAPRYEGSIGSIGPGGGDRPPEQLDSGVMPGQSAILPGAMPPVAPGQSAILGMGTPQQPGQSALFSQYGGMPQGGAPTLPGQTQPMPARGGAGGLDLTPRQVAILRTMPPEAGMAILANLEFAKNQGRKTTEIAGRLIDSETGEMIADFSSEEAALRQASRPQNVVNMPGNPTPDERGQGAFAEENAKTQAKYFDQVAQAGAQAQVRMGDIDQLMTLIEMTPQGAGQEYLNRGASVLSRFGVDLGEYANVPAAQAFQSIVSRIAPTLRVAGSGATSDFEMQQFLASLPAIGNMPGGNRIIASNLKKITERSVQEANIAAQVQGGDLTPAQGRKKILELGSLSLDLPTFSGAPVGGPGGAPGAPGGARRVDQLPEGFQ
jgi:hypothetical protein